MDDTRRMKPCLRPASSASRFSGELCKIRCKHCTRRRAQVCPTRRHLKDNSLLGSSVHGISQARILEWVAIASCRRSSRPRDRTLISCVLCIAGGFFTPEPPESTLHQTLLHFSLVPVTASQRSLVNSAAGHI